MTQSEDLVRLLSVSEGEADAICGLLNAYAGLVARWNPAINVVAKSTLPDFWSRHILDSLQIFPLVPTTSGKWLDLGSGGGLPGLVVAILCKVVKPDLRVTLVESDQRKSVFLREASRVLDLQTVILAQRIEDLPPQHADVVSARALSALDQLCGYAHQHLVPEGIAVFLKGSQIEEELHAARLVWNFELQMTQSVTNSASSVLTLRGLRRGE